jgi:hypothetical protein
VKVVLCLFYLNCLQYLLKHLLAFPLLSVSKAQQEMPGWFTTDAAFLCWLRHRNTSQTIPCYFSPPESLRPLQSHNEEGYSPLWKPCSAQGHKEDIARFGNRAVLRAATRHCQSYTLYWVRSSKTNAYLWHSWNVTLNRGLSCFQNAAHVTLWLYYKRKPVDAAQESLA